MPATSMRQLVLACETCGRVAEVDGDKVFAAIDKAAGARPAFSAKGAVVEVWGLCANCAGEAGAGAWKGVSVQGDAACRPAARGTAHAQPARPRA